jgi:5-formyltetrahydrofolate cyclo-ligase
VEQIKASLRHQLLKQRLALSPEETARRSRLIFETVRHWQPLHDASTIMTYLSVNHEVQTYDLARYLLEHGKRLIIPKTDVERRHIIPCELASLDDLEPGPFNIPEPKPGKTRPIPVPEIDLHVIPGIVFDLRGGRIGYGLGFYDAFLAKANPDALRVALAFDFQLLPTIPQDVWDVPMNVIITDTQFVEAEKLPPHSR